MKLCGYCYSEPKVLEVDSDDDDPLLMSCYAVECTNEKCPHMPTTAVYTSREAALKAWETCDIHKTKSRGIKIA